MHLSVTPAAGVCGLSNSFCCDCKYLSIFLFSWGQGWLLFVHRKGLNHKLGLQTCKKHLWWDKLGCRLPAAPAALCTEGCKALLLLLWDGWEPPQGCPGAPQGSSISQDLGITVTRIRFTAPARLVFIRSKEKCEALGILSRLLICEYSVFCKRKINFD